MNISALDVFPAALTAYLSEHPKLSATITETDLDGIELPLRNATTGKGFRRLLLLSLCDYLNIQIQSDDQRLNTISRFVDILHDSSLLIDDIEDNSKTRRNEPCAYIQYGIALTLNCGTFGIFKATNELISFMDHEKDNLFSPAIKYDILKIVNEEIMNLHVGQGLEIFWRDVSLEVPELIDYIKMIRMKTSGMLRIMARLFSKFFSININDEDRILKLMDFIGIAYQIRDDYLNLATKDAADILEGKFSFPILLGINKELEQSKSSRIYHVMVKKYKQKADVQMVLQLLKETSIFDQNKQLINSIVDHIIKYFKFEESFPINHLLLKLKLDYENQ
ncbi:hypothetical protein QEN19_001947 [Hanseniaspora menglaensis]